LIGTRAEYKMGHQITSEVVTDVKQWLEEKPKKKVEKGIWIMN